MFYIKWAAVALFMDSLLKQEYFLMIIIFSQSNMQAGGLGTGRNHGEMAAWFSTNRLLCNRYTLHAM